MGMGTSEDQSSPREAGGLARHRVQWVATGLRAAAADAGVALCVGFSETVAAGGLACESELGVTRLGAGVVIHTCPAGEGRRPIVLGYADGKRQWYRGIEAAGR